MFLHSDILPIKFTPPSYASGGKRLLWINMSDIELFQAIGQPVFILDANHVIIAANPAAEKLTGLSGEKLKGKKCHSVIHGTEESAACCPLDKLIASGRIETFEMKMETRDKTFLVSCTPVLDEQGKIEKVIHISTDISEIRKAERALHASEARYRKLHDSITDAFVIIDMEGNIKEFNDVYREMLGYGREELSRLNYRDITPQKWHAFEEDIVRRQILPSGHSDVYEKEYRRKDGTAFPVELRTFLIRDDDGNPLEMWAIIREITERKRAEAAIKETNARFQAFMDYSQSLVIIKDHELRPVYFNKLYRELFPADDWMGKKPGEVFPPEVAEAMSVQDRKALSEGSVHYEETWTDKSGKEHVFETRKFRIDRRSSQPLLGAIINDITKRKRAEENLKESQNRYRQLIDQAADGIFVVDEKGNYTLVNSAFCRMIGYAEQELLALNVLDTYPDELRDVGRDRISRVVAGESLRFERVMKRRDGSIFFVEMSVSRLDDGRQQGIIHDITERKKAEEEKKKLEVQLSQAQKMEAIGTLAGGVAHDFNNILLAVLGYAQLALEDISSPEKARRDIMEVLKAGDRARDLVNQILTFSRKTEAVSSPLDLRGALLESLKMIRAIIPSSIEIRQDLADTGLIVSNQIQIQQILMNLCTNAAHAMEEKGGVITIGLGKERLTDDAAAGSLGLMPGTYLRLRVADTGHGMTGETMQRVFEPYFTTKEIGSGTGLGLSVVHGIIKSLGGAIHCSSEPGKGTTFDIFLPEAESSKGTESLHREGSMPTGTERILFVDDEPALAELARELLDKLGYRVTVRTSSIEALDLFVKDPDGYDLVITDMTMPGMTGDVLAEKIIGTRSDIPVILCTGYSNHISERKAKELGIREFIMKPFEMKDFAAKVRRVLDA